MEELIKWSNENVADNGELHLFPAELYDSIPEGFMLTDLDGELFPFEKGVTSKDSRRGYLAYGVTNPITQ